MIEKKIEDKVFELCEKQITKIFEHFFDIVKDSINMKKSIEKAQEGTLNDVIDERIKMMAEEYHDKYEIVDTYTEEEFESIFKKYCEEIGFKEEESEISVQELYQRFKIFTKNYISELEKTLSFGERRLIQRTAQISDKLDQALTRKEFEESAKENTDLIRKMLDEKKNSFITVPYNQDVTIIDYERKYTFLGNTFDFAKNEIAERCQDSFNNGYNIISFSINNVGLSLIGELEISQFKMFFCKDTEENTESYYYYQIVSEHDESEKNTVNLLPGADQKIHFIIKRNDKFVDEEDEYDDINVFLQDEYEYGYDSLYISFKLRAEISNGNELNYNVIMFLSKKEVEEGNIVGNWSIDFVTMDSFSQVT